MGESLPNIRFDQNTQLFLSASSRPGNRGTSFYNHFFRDLGINAVYLARKCDDAKALVQALQTLSVAGCSVSMPLKTAVIPFLQRLDPLAARLQSVNTIVQEDGRMIGFNTDYAGFVEPLRRRGLNVRAVAVHGYGSVAGTIVAALTDLFPGVPVTVFGRDSRKASAFANHHRVGVGDPLQPGASDLVVNAAPTDALSEPLLLKLVDTSAAFFDVTDFSGTSAAAQRVRTSGKPLLTGEDMFCFQFLQQFEIYTGHRIAEERYSAAAIRLGFRPVAG